MAHLLIQTATGSPIVHELNGGTVTIGRTQENTIVLDDPSVSSHHAAIEACENGWLLRDLGSSNGTTRNERPVQEASLTHNDRITFGAVECRFEGPSRSPKWLYVAIAIGALSFVALGLTARHLFGRAGGPSVVERPPASVSPPTGSKGASATKPKPEVRIDLRTALSVPLKLDAATLSSTSAVKGSESQLLKLFTSTEDRSFSSEEFSGSCRRSFSLRYVNASQVEVKGVEEHVDTMYDRAFVGGRKSSWEPIKGHFFEVRIDPDEAIQFDAIRSKFYEWTITSYSESLAYGIEKDLGKLGGSPVTFITPDRLKLGGAYFGKQMHGVIMDWQDVELVTKLIASLPQLKGRIESEIAYRIKAAEQLREKSEEEGKKQKDENERAANALR